MTSSAPPKRKRAEKLVDALSASSLIAYIGTAEFTANHKAVLLFLAPWIALVGNVLIVILGIIARGFAELSVVGILDGWRKKSAQKIIDDPTASQADKSDATRALNETKNNGLRVVGEMSTKLHKYFAGE
jgi:hypothetical protein